MAKILPYTKCPQCGSNVLVDTIPYVKKCVYLKGVCMDSKVSKVGNTHKIVCAKCNFTKYYNYVSYTKQVI